MKKTIIVVAVVLAVVGVGFWLMQQDTVSGTAANQLASSGDFSHIPGDSELKSNLQKAGLEALSAEGTTLHIHQHLDLTVDGQNIKIPADIGVGTFFISPIHTHDTSGILHVESPVVKDFTLGQFFDEWGVQFTDSCIGSKCADENNQLIVGVNGEKITNPRGYVLKPHDEIEVWYGLKTQSPKLIKKYEFPASL